MNGTAPLVQKPVTAAQLATEPGWAIVHSGRHSYVGRAAGEDRESGAIRLAPVFELHRHMQIDPQRGAASQLELVLPVGMVGASSLRVRPDVLVMLSDLDPKGLPVLAMKISQAMGCDLRTTEGAPRIVLPGHR